MPGVFSAVLSCLNPNFTFSVVKSEKLKYSLIECKEKATVFYLLLLILVSVDSFAEFILHPE